MLRAETSCNFYWGEAWVGRCNADLDEAASFLDQAGSRLTSHQPLDSRRPSPNARPSVCVPATGARRGRPTQLAAGMNMTKVAGKPHWRPYDPQRRQDRTAAQQRLAAEAGLPYVMRRPLPVASRERYLGKFPFRSGPRLRDRGKHGRAVAGSGNAWARPRSSLTHLIGRRYPVRRPCAADRVPPPARSATGSRPTHRHTSGDSRRLAAARNQAAAGARWPARRPVAAPLRRTRPSRRRYRTARGPRALSPRR